MWAGSFIVVLLPLAVEFIFTSNAKVELQHLHVCFINLQNVADFLQTWVEENLNLDG